MKPQTGWMAAGLLIAAVGGALTQTPAAPILQQTFEDEAGGWVGMGTTAKVTLTTEAANVKAGKSALKFDYGIKKGETNLLILPIADSKLSKMQSLSFWVKANHSAPLVIALGEKDGGRYCAAFTVPKDKWQRVELTPADFILNVGKDDPKDPDGKLDLDKVENVGIVDFGQIFVQSDDANFLKLFHVQTGDQTLYVDDFTVSETKLSEPAATSKDDYRFDTFARPQVSWLGVGEAQISRVTGKPLEGAGLQTTYHQAPGTVMGILRAVKGGELAGRTQLRFTAATAKATTIIVQLEESDGGKYNASVELPGNSEKKDFTLALADLSVASDSKDDNTKLDLDKVTQILFIDASGLTGATDQDNTLWLNNLRATVK